MSLFAVLSTDDTFTARLSEALPVQHGVARAPSWNGLYRLVRERPISAVFIDSDHLAPPSVTDGARVDPFTHAVGGDAPIDRLASLRHKFPSVGVLVVAKRGTPPEVLFALGQAGLADLRLLRVEEIGYRLTAELEHSLKWSAASRVSQALASRVSRRFLVIIRRAIETLPRRLSADQFARVVGMHRPQLSQKLVAAGLPSVGRMLLWGRLLQAGAWLVDPGRTAESVSRQLEYSTGAAFRRALRTRLGATPTQVVEGGGLPFVLDRFLDECPQRPAAGAATAPVFKVQQPLGSRFDVGETRRVG